MIILLMRAADSASGRVVGAALGYCFLKLLQGNATPPIADLREAWERRGDAFHCDGTGELYVPRPVTAERIAQ